MVAVRGRSGAAVDHLQFLFVDVNTGQYVESQRFGGGGGSEFLYQAPPGQYINKVYASYGNTLNLISFETNLGDKSRQFGQPGPRQGQFIVQGKRITGVRVRYGNLIDKVQFLAAQ